MSLSKTLYLLLSTGSTQKEPYRHEIVDRDVKIKLTPSHLAPYKARITNTKLFLYSTLISMLEDIIYINENKSFKQIQTIHLEHPVSATCCCQNMVATGHHGI